MIIYCLCHPTTKEIRYIGVTSLSLSQRLSQHIWDSKNKLSHKSNWIKSVYNSTGEFPTIEELDVVDDGDWELMEQYWISQFKTWGISLVNTHLGGVGIVKDVFGRKRSIEAHKKKVYQYDIAGNFIAEFDSIKSASAYFNVAKNTIGECAKGRSKTSVGFRWSFVKTDKLQPNTRKGRSDQYKVKVTFSDGLIKEFTSKQQAIKFLGRPLNRKTINNLKIKVELIKI